MKQLKSGTYKASNVTFNPNTMEANSYGWWTFVKRINGKVVFNAHKYSVTTAKHQHKVRSIMVQLGIRPDVIVDTRLCLNNYNALSDAKSRFLQSIKELNDLIDKKGSQYRANVLRQRRITMIMEELDKLEGVL